MQNNIDKEEQYVIKQNPLGMADLDPVYHEQRRTCEEDSGEVEVDLPFDPAEPPCTANFKFHGGNNHVIEEMTDEDQESSHQFQ